MTYISDSLRKLVVERANGCCEYCRLHQNHGIYRHEVDHIIPEKHRGETNEFNLCLACLDCNRHKGSDFVSFDPETKEVTLLFNPRTQKWDNHFKLLENGFIEPITSYGRVTVFILKLNDEIRIRARRALYEAGLYPCDTP